MVMTQGGAQLRFRVQAMNRFVIICAVLAALVAVFASAAPSEGNGKWFFRPGSPTMRRTIKDGVGQQIDHTRNVITGHQTSAYLALGENARHSSPERTGQPSTGGEASTSQKKKKGRGK